MKIFVDADACPVISIIEKVAEEYEIDVIFCERKEWIGIEERSSA